MNKIPETPNTGWAYPASADVSYAYYGATGLLETMTEPPSDTSSSYEYDGRGWLTSYSPPQPASRTIAYTYNNLGQKLSVSNGSFVTNYEYYANGWLKNVKKGAEPIAGYTYNPVGIGTRVDFGNSTWEAFGYDADPRYRLEDIHYAYKCGSGVADQGGLALTRDKAGNSLTWGDAGGLYGRVYSYDENSRLESANYPGLGPVGFSYDWAGNRANPGGMQYNLADQLTSWPGQHSYEYYLDGGLHYLRDAGGVVQKTYGYSPVGLLSSVEHAGAGTSSMTWDAGGNRTGFTSSTGGSYTFVYDPTAGVPSVVEEVTPTGSVYYIRGPDGALICRVQGESTQYYHFDDLGSTLFLTGSDGTVTDKYAYDAWGSLTSHTGGTSQPYQYVGQLGYYTHYQDANLPLLQLGVRLYDPLIGRFITQDPARDGLNWYAYAGNDPVNGVDPTGNETIVFYYHHPDSKKNLDYAAKQSAYFDSRSPDVVMLPFGTAREFVNKWNSLNYKTIDDMYIYAHSSEGEFYFQHNINLKFSGELSFNDLKQKDVSGMVYLLSCHGGEGKEGNNLAWMFAEKTGADVRATAYGIVFPMVYGERQACLTKSAFFNPLASWRTFWYDDSGEARSSLSWFVPRAWATNP